MLRQRNPRLFGIDVVFNSFTGCISDAPEKFSWTPKMSFGEIASQPRMLAQKFKGAISFKQLKCFANAHCWRQLNKQMDMVNSDVKFVNFTSIIDSYFTDEPLAIDPYTKKFEWVHRVFRFPHKMESVLSIAMIKALQIHFFPPESARNRAHANSIYLISGAQHQSLISIQDFQELNLAEEGNSSLGLKAEVSLPFM